MDFSSSFPQSVNDHCFIKSSNTSSFLKHLPTSHIFYYEFFSTLLSESDY